MSDTAPTGGIGERLAKHISDALIKERELTKKEQGELDRALRGALDETKKEILQQVSEIGMSFSEVMDFVKDAKKRQQDADDVSKSKSTIVVPPEDVKPVVPEAPETPPTTGEDETPKRSWKDLF